MSGLIWCEKKNKGFGPVVNTTDAEYRKGYKDAEQKTYKALLLVSVCACVCPGRACIWAQSAPGQTLIHWPLNWAVQ